MKPVSRPAIILQALSIAAALALTGCSHRHFQNSSQTVVILHENDVHCRVDGYAVINGMKTVEEGRGNATLLLSAGDFASGGTLGAISKGGYITTIMNACSYDAVTLGNHEFDFGMERLTELAEMLETEILCCNFASLPDGKPVFRPYEIFSRGGRNIAVIGIATPSSFVSSTPANFQDENGNFKYTLHENDLCTLVQGYIDEVRAAGADYVLALSHLGDDKTAGSITSPELIAGTSGLDAVLDGHAHNLIVGRRIRDIKGKAVLLCSTGAYFENIGKLIIGRDGKLRSSIIATRDYPLKDNAVAATSEAIKEEYENFSSSYVGQCQADMPADDKTGPRTSRRKETGLGDFCADAIRSIASSDIAICGGGSIRAAISAGELSFNDIFRLFPFLNDVGIVKASGQVILDALEYSASMLPEEFGGFLQVSGLRLTIDSRIPSPVIVDNQQLFAGFSGPQRRVREVMVGDESKGFVPLDPEAEYTIAASVYTLQNKGDGYTMFPADVKSLGILDVNVLELYIKETLKGSVPARYSKPQGRITIL